jgi:DNA mismatch repair ATPase MutS
MKHHSLSRYQNREQLAHSSIKYVYSRQQRFGNISHTNIVQKWSILGSQIIEATAAITAAEKAAFENLRSEVNAASELIRRNARILDELDVTLSFANLAEEMGFVRPVLKEE